MLSVWAPAVERCHILHLENSPIISQQAETQWYFNDFQYNPKMIIEEAELQLRFIIIHLFLTTIHSPLPFQITSYNDEPLVHRQQSSKHLAKARGKLVEFLGLLLGEAENAEILLPILALFVASFASMVEMGCAILEAPRTFQLLSNLP